MMTTVETQPMHPVASPSRSLSTAAGRRAVRGRWLAERLVLVLVAVAGLQTWYLAGMPVPMRITSGSMAPELLGQHREVVCGDCGCRFACGTDVRPRPWAVCPNCGLANQLAGLPDLKGDGVLVSKAVFQFRQPRRWEVVAFRDPERARRIAVKRVVGLPGESVEIRDGEVFVDGRIQRKPPAQQKAMAVLVHDAAFTPQGALPPRWQGDRSDSRWDGAGGRVARPATPDREAIDWLSYRHWIRLPGQPDKVQRGPITNVSAFNQAYDQRSETVHPVRDLWLSFRLLKTEGEGELYVMLTDGRQPFQVQLDPGHARYTISHNDQTRQGAWPDRSCQEPAGWKVDVALVDCQLTLALDGQVLATWPYEPARERPPATLRPVAIGARGLGVVIGELRLYRDVYYTRPVGRTARWGVDVPCHLGEGEYFVLGDNSPISLDSRTWPQGPAVTAALIIGKPWLAYGCARRVWRAGRSFLIPTLDGIRYIR